ncbi:MAG: GGDEF domain-containing phosphodiesterase, partial [Gammaproteobacteria bacterium]|nr:GGDEF domain-containing phosphodiesterase [Gammaproteobacteria bacterium]
NCQLGVAKKIALKLAESVEALALVWDGKNIEASASIGVTPVTAEHANVDGVIAAAEVACSSIKDRGGNGVSVYRSGDEELVQRKSYMDLVGRIQDTLRSDRFVLYCQPIVPLQPDDAEVHGEVLLRMQDEAGDIVAPGLFLPAAERYHLMPAIDRWVVGKTLAMLEDSGVFKLHSSAMISVNLSGQTLSDESFVRFVHDILDKSSVPARNLCFEITETTAISDADQAQRFIAAFKERGVLFALDDFGTGLSSFSYLKELPVDFLKIDGSFVKEICTDPIAETMVSAINQVGHTMNLKTIGEFVENDAIQERLTALGVDYGQGYGIAKPKPFSEYLADTLAESQVKNTG